MLFTRAFFERQLVPLEKWYFFACDGTVKKPSAVLGSSPAAPRLPRLHRPDSKNKGAQKTATGRPRPCGRPARKGTGSPGSVEQTDSAPVGGGGEVRVDLEGSGD